MDEEFFIALDKEMAEINAVMHDIQPDEDKPVSEEQKFWYEFGALMLDHMVNDPVINPKPART